ncbi:MAG: ABC transporter ATP-binding protein [Lachnospiraceae bacterium]|nr:ABC transporter ATP-binding protein [Lachnospiraceae bacterium]
MSKDVVIRVQDLCKDYALYDKPSDRLREALHLTGKKLHKDHHALSSVSFTIERGETVGIIGTNGSGKSTILKLITGVLTPTGGELEVNGRISALLELGAGFNMEYSGIENIYLNGAMTGFSREEIDQRLSEILEFADIGDYVYQPVKTYSSGMFVRLAFALAINIEPEILIVDEALSVGDVFFQAKCYRKFEEFRAQGRTILFVSHDMSSIAKYCDRVILLEKGKKLGEGKPKEMLDLYKQVLVGQYAADADISLGEDRKLPGENTEALEYGSGKACIDKVWVTDAKGLTTNALIKGDECSVYMEVSAKEDLPAPIFALSFKDVKGTEISGTNTMFEKAFLRDMKAGEKLQIRFTQRMDLQGGEYLLSFGLTGYEGDEFTVYHRLYDALHITVISDKNTVGYFDMNSRIEIKEPG